MYKTNRKARRLNRLLALLFALAVLAGALAGCAGGDGGSSSGGQSGSTAEAVKTITLTVVHRDGSSKDFTIETGKETLGEALADEGLIEGEDSEYGLFVTKVDGEEADGSKHEFWSLTIGGEMASTGVDSTPIEDGGQFELTLSTY